MTRKKINSLASTAQRKALINWSKIVRNRDGNKCVVCKTTEHLNAHHILEKRYYGAIKYDPNVGVTVCAKCHLFSKYSAHKNGVWFTLWLQENRPEQYDWILKNLLDGSRKPPPLWWRYFKKMVGLDMLYHNTGERVRRNKLLRSEGYGLKDAKAIAQLWHLELLASKEY